MDWLWWILIFVFFIIIILLFVNTYYWYTIAYPTIDDKDIAIAINCPVSTGTAQILFYIHIFILVILLILIIVYVIMWWTTSTDVAVPESAIIQTRTPDGIILTKDVNTATPATCNPIYSTPVTKPLNTNIVEPIYTQVSREAPIISSVRYVPVQNTQVQQYQQERSIRVPDQSIRVPDQPIRVPNQPNLVPTQQLQQYKSVQQYQPIQQY